MKKPTLGDVSSSNFVSSQLSIPVPAFPVSVLPAEVRELVEAGAASLGAPPDLIATPLLANAGAAIGRTRSIVLKVGFEQWPVLWTVIVAPPGSVKTPSLNLARHALDEEQRIAHERYLAEKATDETELGQWQDRERGDRGPRPERPVMEHFFSTDSTVEAVAQMLQGSAGFSFTHDEIISFVQAFDAYRSGRGGDRQRWLSMWRPAPLKLDRKSQEPIFIPRPIVCVAGGCQPEMLTMLADEAGRRDGFLERFLWSYPDIEVGGWTEATVSASQKQAPRVQGVVATPPCAGESRCSLSASAGVFHPRVLRGRVLSARATAARSSAECRDRSVPLGKY